MVLYTSSYTSIFSYNCDNKFMLLLNITEKILIIYSNGRYLIDFLTLTDFNFSISFKYSILHHIFH